MLNTTQKQKIVTGLKKWMSDKQFSQAKAAGKFGVNKSQISRILKGNFDILSDAKFLAIARELQLSLKNDIEWQTAKTQTFAYIYKQLDTAQKLSTSGLLCDIADIGKTFTAKHYVRANRNAVYIDCSLTKTKREFVKKIASEFGLDNSGRYVDMFNNLVYFLNNVVETPLIVIDEAGDLKHPAFLELKALWNATENNVGWYMMGADGLRVKIERYLALKKVGYTEIFSRYGKKFQKISPESKDDLQKFTIGQVAMIAKANGIANVKSIYAKTEGSLRRVFHEIKKLKLQTAN